MQVITRFHTYVVGAKRPIGSLVSQFLRGQGLPLQELDFTEPCRLATAEVSQRFMVLATSVFFEDDFPLVAAWLELAQAQQIPVLLLSSLAVFPTQPDKLWQEQDTLYADTALAQRLLQLEALVRQNPQHVILRLGQELSLQTGDYGSSLLQRMQHEQQLGLNDTQFFSPTAADAVADVVQSLLKQINCNPRLWGTYHCAGVEPVTTFQFASALLTEAKAFEDFDEITLAAMLSAGELPSLWVANGDNTKLFHTFGVRPKAWRKSLGRLLKGYFQR